MGGGARRSVLLLDTCGERASVALVVGGGEVREAELPARGASAHLLGTVRDLLHGAAESPDQLQGIGVVSGPGSFTGVRVGMAVAKGLSLSTGVPLIAVSRLAVLAETAELQDGFAVLGAGRDDVYVREQVLGVAATERMMRVEELLKLTGTREVVCVAGESLPAALTARAVVLSARCARGPVERALREGRGTATGGADANYVRNEQGIYRARAGVVAHGS